ncbi:MAG: F0F1 ATP synthase subunit A [Bacteroidales bacterium]|nr:F0F1 ATP synthase subunit A [Bacteroidales bacterium]
MTKFKLLLLILPLFAFAMVGCSSGSYTDEPAKDINPGAVIVGHVTDSHIWHLFDYCSKDGKEHVVAVDLPIILIDDGAVEIFSSKKFHHGHAAVTGKKHTYALVGGTIEENPEVVILADAYKTPGISKEEIICVDPDTHQQLLDEKGKPVKPIDISITKTAFAILVAVTLLIALVLYTARQYKKRGNQAPHGVQTLMEILILHVRDGIVEPILGHNTNRFLPYLLTLFFFIFFCNILGLIPIFPAGANITGNIAVTAILAFITFVIVNLSGNKHYWKDIFNTPGVPAWLKIFPLMPIVELSGVFIKPVVLMLRLFANMTAGHIIILGFIVIIFILSNSFGTAVGGTVSVFSVLFAVFISVLECLVAYIQAFVFTMLTALYIGMAVEKPEEEAEANSKE